MRKSHVLIQFEVCGRDSRARKTVPYGERYQYSWMTLLAGSARSPTASTIGGTREPAAGEASGYVPTRLVTNYHRVTRQPRPPGPTSRPSIARRGASRHPPSFAAPSNPPPRFTHAVRDCQCFTNLWFGERRSLGKLGRRRIVLFGYVSRPKPFVLARRSASPVAEGPVVRPPASLPPRTPASSSRLDTTRTVVRPREREASLVSRSNMNS
jgi:hypothetical protein